MHPQSTAKRAAIYIRVSTDDQEENSSLESQRDACQQLADALGYTVVAIFRDVASGAALDRKQFTAMLGAMQSNELDAVICLNPDRLSRDMKHQAYALTVAERAGVTMHFVQSPPSDTLEGRILEVVRGVVAEVERVDIAKRTQSGVRARVAEGHYLPGPRAPYGFRFADPEPAVAGKQQRTKTRLVIDESTAPVVRRIFEHVAAGKSANSLEKVLTAERIPTPTELAKGATVGTRTWNSTTIRYLLRNRLYLGEASAFVWKVARPHVAKVQIPLDPITEPIALQGVVEPLIQPGLWQQANDQLDRNRRELSSPPENPEDALLRVGYIFCGHCGRPLTVNRLRGTTHYRCKYPREEHGGHWVGITAATIDNAVWSKVMDVLTDPQYVQQYMRQWLEGDTSTAEELSHVEAELGAIATKERRLVDQLGRLDDPTPVVAMLNDLTARKRMLVLQQNNLAMRRDIYITTLERWETMLARWKWQGFADHLKLQNMSYQDRRMWLANLNVRADLWQPKGGPGGQRYTITMAIDESFWLPSEAELTGAGEDDYRDPTTLEGQYPSVYRTTLPVPVSVRTSGSESGERPFDRTARS
jgi:site-specific DNA recombinase